MATTKQSEIAMWRREERDRVGKESVAKSHSSLRPFWFGTKMRRGSFNRSSAKSSKWQHVAHVALAKKFVQCKREMNSQTEGERDKERVRASTCYARERASTSQQKRGRCTFEAKLSLSLSIGVALCGVSQKGVGVSAALQTKWLTQQQQQQLLQEVSLKTPQQHPVACLAGKLH